MKKISMLFVALLAANTVTAEQNTNLSVTFNDKRMCLHAGKVYSLGSQITTNEKDLVCLNARESSYYLDKSYPAKWVPLSAAEKQINR